MLYNKYKQKRKVTKMKYLTIILQVLTLAAFLGLPWVVQIILIGLGV